MSKMNENVSQKVNIMLCISIVLGVTVMLLFLFTNMVNVHYELTDVTIGFKLSEIAFGKQLLEGVSSSSCKGTPWAMVMEITFALSLIFGCTLISLKSIGKKANIACAIVFGLLTISSSVLLFFMKNIFISANENYLPIFINKYTVKSCPTLYLCGGLGIASGLVMISTPVIIAR